MTQKPILVDASWSRILVGFRSFVWSQEWSQVGTKIGSKFDVEFECRFLKKGLFLLREINVFETQGVRLWAVVGAKFALSS